MELAIELRLDELTVDTELERELMLEDDDVTMSLSCVHCTTITSVEYI